jgi:hypothetical protein
MIPVTFNIHLEESLQNNKNDPQQKYDNGDLVDTVHHFNIDITGSGRVFPSEKITTYFAH